MQVLYVNEKVIQYLKGANSLLDAKLLRFELYSTNLGVSADLHFFMRSSSEFRQLVLRLELCKEVSFSYTDDFFFYNIERIKMLQVSADEYFVSLDPFDESGQVSVKDGDFIRSSGLKLLKICNG